jgi:hypothetical protein
MADEGFSLLVPVDHDPWSAGPMLPPGGAPQGGQDAALASSMTHWGAPAPRRSPSPADYPHDPSGNAGVTLIVLLNPTCSLQ